MKNLMVLALALFLSVAAQVNDSPLWMRYCAIPPDGQTIAFSYQGNIYMVPSSGGETRQLTTHSVHDTHPVWSPNGQKIVFVSNHSGNFDVFLMNKEGGEPKRLTTHSTSEYPMTFKDSGHTSYLANILRDAKDAQSPNTRFIRVYEMSIDGGRPDLHSSLYTGNTALGKGGSKLLYNDYKGYEDPWYRHHQSSVTRDIWLCTFRKGRSLQKIITSGSEDRNPVWAVDRVSFCYLGEEKGSFSIFKKDLVGNSEKQIMTHTTHSVRPLTFDNSGTLYYSYGGRIYTVKEGQRPVKVSIQIVADKIENDVTHRLLTDGTTDIAVSPNGKGVASITCGDIYVTSIEYETVHQIVNTPRQERNIDLSPDRRSLVYSAEREGTWGIYENKLTRDEDKQFTYVPELKEEFLVVSGQTLFQSLYPPDGNEVASLENHTTLRVINRKAKQARIVLNGKYLYSYSNGDWHFQWSPDSEWFLVNYIPVGGRDNADIALVRADGSGEVTNLMESGYSDDNAKWVLDGKAMIWSSDRAGFRNHGSWGAERDVYIMFSDGKAYDKLRLSKEELALVEADEGKDKDEDEASDKDSDRKKEDKGKSVTPLKLGLENRKDRIIRLTANSSLLGNVVLAPKGDKLYYCAAFEKGFDLWEHGLKEKSTKLLFKDVGQGTLFADKKAGNLYLTAGGRLKEIELKDSKEKPIVFKVEFAHRSAKKRAYIFHHAWRQILGKFYSPMLRGMNWEGCETAYARFLSCINDNFDPREMLSGLSGKLNGSHTGVRYNPGLTGPETASLGAFFGNTYTGDGLRIEEVIAKNPLTLADSQIKKDYIIERMDGIPIKKDTDYYPRLLYTPPSSRDQLKIER